MFYNSKTLCKRKKPAEIGGLGWFFNLPTDIATNYRISAKKHFFLQKYLVVSKKSSTFAPTNLPRFPQDQRA